MQILFIKYKESLLITLKKTFQLWIRSFISLTAVLNNIRIAKTLLICQGKSPCHGVGGFVKRYVVKPSLQRPLYGQI